MQRSIEYDATLQDYVAEHGQVETSKQLGLSNGAVWVMLGADREIYVKKIRGKLYYGEFKDFRRGGKAA